MSVSVSTLFFRLDFQMERSMELQNAVKEALNALYHHPDDTVRMQADRWLQDFQGIIDAWQVADNLLHDATSNLETLIFCSQTLRSKVQRDIEELPSEAVCALQDSLNTLLKKFHKGPPKVRTQISIAVAALAVHISAEDWGGGGIVGWLRDEMNSHPEYIPGFLELLTVLPEEVYNYKIAARPERRRQFEKELTSQMEAALGILTACLQINELKEKVLEAFASWLRLKHRIHGSVLASHPLVLTAITSLHSEIHSEASVNVISELIHHSAAGSSGGAAVNMPLIQVIVPQIMNLKAQLMDSSKDEEDVKAIARLFADMGDSYVELIAAGSDESMLIVHALLEVASHPEYDIASMTFNFWHNLQLILTKRDSYIAFGNEASVEAERNRRLQVFRSAYESLVSLVSFRVQYPQDYQDLSFEDLKEFKQTRYAVADVLIDAASVLGGDATLKILYTELVEGVALCRNEHSEWRPAEAALFCIRVISNYVSVNEAEVMPQIMSLLPKLPQQPQLLQTVCLTIGAYSKWLDTVSSDPSILASVLGMLTSGMAVSKDSAAAAALALRHICDDCRKKLCGYLDGLYNVYRTAVNGEGSLKVSAEDSLHLVEALSMVITELPQDDATKALEMLCLPVVTPLQEVINQGPEVLHKKHPRDLTIHIDRFAYIFRHVNHPEAVADAIQRLWPIFKAIFDIRAWDMRTMESLCRACKYAVRTSKRYMGITIGAILEEIQGLYQQHQQPCFLYLSSEVIKIFGSDPSCASYLQNLIEALFKRTTCLLTSIEEFTSKPDVADDCFLLASRCIRYCSPLFIPSSVFPSLVDCAMIGITVQHREASNSILTFLSDIFDLAKSCKGEEYLSLRDTVIIPRGASITRILIASLTGALPSSRLETVTHALLALTRAYHVQALEWAKESVSLIPLTAVAEVERTRFLQALSDAALGADVNALMAPIEELSDVCRRNRTVQEIVKGALKPHELKLVPVL
ncbi:transportin MOS14-like isoform X2 [Mangifera indica]|uniref:transportin MOS14-like isoform X2 n=1 Tax=Mangifera indica TaxID=29780 RepID=UPI001CFB017A|nr:transportin MOS14-like isoform X2 [Mangifera indica]